MNISDFMRRHYRHFNAAVAVDAAEAWVKHLRSGGKMMLTLAGAMSTAELGISVAELIRRGKIHAISCTGANLEEDIFNLVAHKHYRRIPHYRTLKAEEEQALAEQGMNRVTDTCIPEHEAVRRIENVMLELWKRLDASGQSMFPHELFYELIRSGSLKQHYEIDPKDSWMLAAAEHNLPIFVPGWEDSTTANIFVAHVVGRVISRYSVVRSGTEYMGELIGWYKENCGGSSRSSSKSPKGISERAKGQPGAIGFFQIGGGIAGDFPICVVPLMIQDMQEDVPLWGYFCQISDSTTSFGSYSGAVPNEKISWGKLDVTTPSFVIESDASIVAPLVFQYVLERS